MMHLVRARGAASVLTGRSGVAVHSCVPRAAAACPSHVEDGWRGTYSGFREFGTRSGQGFVGVPKPPTDDARTTTDEREGEAAPGASGVADGSSSRAAAASTGGSGGGFLSRWFGPDKGRAGPEFRNRWAMAVPAFLTHLCIGSPYSWSVVSGPISRELGFVTAAAECVAAGACHATQQQRVANSPCLPGVWCPDVQ